MKNVHVLPTDKFSNLILQTNGELRLSELKLRGQVGNGFTQHIYITSDEEIKEGDWVLDKFNQRWKLEDKKLIGFDSQGIKIFSTDNVLGHECKKIILTTNQDLIKDGVQAIDDEFLEWFVKNPSCEFVEVTEYLDSGFSYGYKIIIPKEEPKPNSFCETPEEKYTMNYCDENGCQNRKRELVEPKQETLEDFIESQPYYGSCTTEYLEGIEIGAKWQQERMYSEEKINKILQKLEEIKIMINIR